MKNFERHRHANKRLESAKTIIKALLELRSDSRIHPPHLRKFLSNGLWQITQANGKYNTQFCSRAALDALHEGSKQGLQHEHVFERKKMVDSLLERPEKIEEIVERAAGCIVTKTEHALLGRVDPRLDGWDRYRAAKIRVINRETGQPLEF
jgi:hypothetical protein